MGKCRARLKKRPKHYVKRDRHGRFKKWTHIGRSLSADRRKRVGHRRIPKTKRGGLKRGYGYLGDYPRRKRKRRRVKRKLRRRKRRVKKFKGRRKLVSFKVRGKKIKFWAKVKTKRQRRIRRKRRIRRIKRVRKIRRVRKVRRIVARRERVMPTPKGRLSFMPKTKGERAKFRSTIKGMRGMSANVLIAATNGWRAEISSNPETRTELKRKGWKVEGSKIVRMGKRELAIRRQKLIDEEQKEYLIK